MATRNGLEPSTSSVTGWRANRLHHRARYGGNNRARTCDLLLVRQMLSQLSYAPEFGRRFRLVISDKTYYTGKPTFCQANFAFFSKNFLFCETAVFPPFHKENQIFFKSS